MALTEDQIASALILLDLPVNTAIAFSFEADRTKMRQAEIASKAMQIITASQETAIIGILTAFETVRYDTDLIDAEGLHSNPMRTRAHLAMQLKNAIGYHPSEDYGGMRLARG